jgi:hypothetical protein
VRPDYRLYACARCRRLVAICSRCDRGQWYCGQACSQASRGERSRAAGQRYQQGHRGRRRHAARQARYRLRRKAAQQTATQKVTHQATPEPQSNCTLHVTTTGPAGPQVRCAVPDAWWRREDAVVCAFCGAVCAPYARWGFLRRRRRAGADVAQRRGPG